MIDAIKQVLSAKAREAAIEAVFSAVDAMALCAQAFGIRRRRMAARPRAGARGWRRVPLTTRQRAACAAKASMLFAEVAVVAAAGRAKA